MPRYFTHYWTNDTWDEEYAKCGEGHIFEGIVGSQFASRDIRGGDCLYAMRVYKGDLYLLCRIAVERLVPGSSDDDRWRDTIVVDQSASSPTRFHHIVPRDVVQSLRFISANGSDRLPITNKGGVEHMALRMMRELTAESALLLDRLIRSYEVAVAKERDRVDALDQEAVDGEADAIVEGARTRVEVNRYERDPGVRLAAIQIHGTRCQVCGFSFEEVYGERGSGYIEIHHLKPLSARPEAGPVDPRTDIAVVCANCHRMIHRRKDDLLTPAQLRSIIHPRQTAECAT